MKPGLEVGLTHRCQFLIPATKSVPHLYPEFPAFQDMPAVFATGFMIGLLEWACQEAIKPYLDWPKEQSLGVDVKFSHLAPTPPGMTVTIDVTVEKIEGRRVFFSASAHDGIDKITEGTHERFIIDAARFNEKILQKTRQAGLV